MINLVEGKDIQKFWTRIEEINERTKKHTKDIKSIERRLKEIEKNINAINNNASIK